MNTQSNIKHYCSKTHGYALIMLYCTEGGTHLAVAQLKFVILLNKVFKTILNFNEFIFVYVVNIRFIFDGEIYLLTYK